MKTATFTLGKYKIVWCEIEACCDVPSKKGDPLYLMTPAVKDYHTFAIAAHEAEHADGLPDSLIHDAGGYPNHGGRHRFMWRIVQSLLKPVKGSTSD